MGNDAKWTFMVYLAGDSEAISSLEEKAFKEIMAVRRDPRVQVAAQFDSTGSGGSLRYCFPSVEPDKLIKDIEKDSGDPETLLDFIEWAIKEKGYTAEHYALVLSGHGCGWARGEPEKIPQNAKSKTPGKEVADNLPEPSPRLASRPDGQTIPKESGSGVGLDEMTGNAISTLELSSVLRIAVAQVLGKQLDLLGMDACLMSNLEVAYEIRGPVRYLVGSESPFAGNWPYKQILNKLTDELDQWKPCDLAKEIVTACVQNARQDCTVTALDLNRAGRVGKSMKGLAEALIRAIPNKAESIRGARTNSISFFGNTLRDIAHFCRCLTPRDIGDDVKEAARQVRDNLESSPDKFVLAHSHNYPGRDPCGGVSVYLPGPPETLSTAYKGLDFTKRCGWARMLRLLDKRKAKLNADAPTP